MLPLGLIESSERYSHNIYIYIYISRGKNYENKPSNFSEGEKVSVNSITSRSRLFIIRSIYVCIVLEKEKHWRVGYIALYRRRESCRVDSNSHDRVIGMRRTRRRAAYTKTRELGCWVYDRSRSDELIRSFILWSMPPSFFFFFL